MPLMNWAPIFESSPKNVLIIPIDEKQENTDEEIITFWQEQINVP